MEDDLQTKGSTPLNIAIFAFGCLVFAGTMYGLTRSSSEDKKVQQLEEVAKEAKAEAAPNQGEFAKMETGGGPEGEAPVPAANNGPEGAAPPDATGHPPAAPSAMSEPAVPPPDAGH